MTNPGAPAGPARLAGSWVLERWWMTIDGTALEPYTDRPEGRLLYADDGQMAALLHHPQWRKVDVAQLDGSRAMLFAAYGGRWRLQGDEVHHEVQLSSVPGMIGRTLVRRVEVLTADELALFAAPEPDAAGKLVSHLLRWRRWRG